MADVIKKATNPNYVDKLPEKPKVEPIWEWNCSNKTKPDNPCNSEPIYQPPNIPPPSECEKRCGSDSFDKSPNDIIKVTQREGTKENIKIVDRSQKDGSKSGKVVKEYSQEAAPIPKN